eukprot:comp18704_c2_seq1/m.20432 comp18704_c2_seq1/g.20432  ORF comp18704_c2_seq1/g.20432 comp18704_c2_seq1/m.20432 type:complete len:481 (-) comp18704_c2_seq1:186-1628(-)
MKRGWNSPDGPEPSSCSENDPAGQEEILADADLLLLQQLQGDAQTWLLDAVTDSQERTRALLNQHPVSEDQLVARIVDHLRNTNSSEEMIGRQASISSPPPPGHFVDPHTDVVTGVGGTKHGLPGQGTLAQGFPTQRDTFVVRESPGITHAASHPPSGRSYPPSSVASETTPLPQTSGVSVSPGPQQHSKRHIVDSELPVADVGGFSGRKSVRSWEKRPGGPSLLDGEINAVLKALGVTKKSISRFTVPILSGLVEDEQGQHAMAFGEPVEEATGDAKKSRNKKVNFPRMKTYAQHTITLRRYFANILTPEEIEETEVVNTPTREYLVEIISEMDYESLCLSEEVRVRQTEFLRHFIDTIVVPACIMDRSAIIFEANTGFYEMLRMTKKEARSRCYLQLIHRDELVNFYRIGMTRVMTASKTKQLIMDVTLRRVSDNQPIKCRVALNIHRDVFGLPVVISAVHIPYPNVSIPSFPDLTIM